MISLSHVEPRRLLEFSKVECIEISRSLGGILAVDALGTKFGHWISLKVSIHVHATRFAHNCEVSFRFCIF